MFAVLSQLVIIHDSVSPLPSTLNQGTGKPCSRASSSLLATALLHVPTNCQLFTEPSTKPGRVISLYQSATHRSLTAGEVGAIDELNVLPVRAGGTCQDRVEAERVGKVVQQWRHLANLLLLLVLVQCRLRSPFTYTTDTQPELAIANVTW